MAVVKVTKHDVTEIDALRSNQEEADTRIELHAVYAANHMDTTNVVVVSPDTDVLVLIGHHRPAINADPIRTSQDEKGYIQISVGSSQFKIYTLDSKYIRERSSSLSCTAYLALKKHLP